jgi:hypothetical protein
VADHGYGCISIGGDIPRSLAEEFLRVLKRSGAGPEPEGGVDFLDLFIDTKDLTPAAQCAWLIANSEPNLGYSDCQAQGGTFDELETWCRMYKIAYDRHSDHLWGVDADNVFYRPELIDEIGCASNNSADTLCDADLVLEAWKSVSRGNMHDALRLLEKALGGYTQVTPLPPLRLVDG